MKSDEQRAADALHHRSRHLQPGDPLTPPLVLAAPFHLPNGTDAPFGYGRQSSPTWQSAEALLAEIEAAPCLLFPSGMAAVTAVFMSTLKTGDAIVLPSDGYYVTRRIAERFLEPLGIDIRLHPTADYANAPIDGAALVWIETPSNPALDVCDIETVVARARATGARTAADNTTMTPLGQRPLERGVDVVVAADTKAPNGHSDVLAGHVATDDDALMTRLHDWRTASGSIPSPFDAWLLHRGLETLDVRFERMCTTAATLAPRLADHPDVATVRFPGLPDDPSHAIAIRQMTRFGSLIGIDLADADTAERFLAECALLERSTSFGGVHSSGERRARWGDDVPAGYVRLSIGCEPSEPLWASIDAALRRSRSCYSARNTR